MIYLQIVVTVILLTQLTRTIQNGISLYRQNKTFKEACGQLSDVTQQDLENQRYAYRLMIEYYEKENQRNK